jgi:hypothetical protein
MRLALVAIALLPMADNGATWSAFSTGLPTHTAVFALAMNGTTLVVAAGNGVWRFSL